MRTAAIVKQSRRAVLDDDDNPAAAIVELCDTIDDAAERIEDALAPLESIKEILSDIEKELRRRNT